MKNIRPISLIIFFSLLVLAGLTPVYSEDVINLAQFEFVTNDFNYIFFINKMNENNMTDVNVYKPVKVLNYNNSTYVLIYYIDKIYVDNDVELYNIKINNVSKNIINNIIYYKISIDLFISKNISFDLGMLSIFPKNVTLNFQKEIVNGKSYVNVSIIIDNIYLNNYYLFNVSNPDIVVPSSYNTYSSRMLNGLILSSVLVDPKSGLVYIKDNSTLRSIGFLPLYSERFGDRDWRMAYGYAMLINFINTLNKSETLRNELINYADAILSQNSSDIQSIYNVVESFYNDIVVAPSMVSGEYIKKFTITMKNPPLPYFESNISLDCLDSSYVLDDVWLLLINKTYINNRFNDFINIILSIIENSTNSNITYLYNLVYNSFSVKKDVSVDSVLLEESGLNSCRIQFIIPYYKSIILPLSRNAQEAFSSMYNLGLINAVPSYMILRITSVSEDHANWYYNSSNIRLIYADGLSQDPVQYNETYCLSSMTYYVLNSLSNGLIDIVNKRSTWDEILRSIERGLKSYESNCNINMSLVNTILNNNSYNNNLNTTNNYIDTSTEDSNSNNNNNFLVKIILFIAIVSLIAILGLLRARS